MKKTQISITERISAAHARLLMDLDGLEQAADDPAGLSPHLERIRAHLGEHFQLEEQDGYMAGILKRKPHLEHAVRALLQEHRQLARTLDELLIGSRRELDGALGPDVRRWVGEMRRHESRENELVEDAFNLDLGTED
jgi:hypothetical protein